VRQYTEHLEVNRRAGTARRYKRVLRTQCAFFQKFHPRIVSLKDIKPSHIEDYKRKRFAGEIAETESEEEAKREEQLRRELESMPKSGSPQANAKYGWLGRKKLHQRVTQKTIKYELQCLHTFFQWAIKQNYLFTNPTTPVERFRLSKKTLPKFMTSGDLRKFFATCEAEQKRIFSTMLLTGMRKGELEHLTWNDIHFELGIIFIQAKEGWDPKTDERIIPISPVLHQILSEQRKHRRSELWVFANKNGNRLSHLLDKLKLMCKRAGMRQATLHSLRHSFGAHLRMAGVSLADIADLMGHKDLATTQIYAKVEQEHLRAVVTKLTPLISHEVSLKSVTREDLGENEQRNLLLISGLGEQKGELAGRQGFDFWLLSNSPPTSLLLPNLFLFRDFALVCAFP
jgi:integrase/recombinase XerC